MRCEGKPRTHQFKGPDTGLAHNNSRASLRASWYRDWHRAQ
jgi:hypothetical protein